MQKSNIESFVGAKIKRLPFLMRKENQMKIYMIHRQHERFRSLQAIHIKPGKLIW